MLLWMRAWTQICFTVLGTLATGPTVSADDRTTTEVTQLKGVDVLITVEGSTTTIRINSDGTAVKKGATESESRPSALKLGLTNQEIVTKQAEAAYRNAKLTREVAEIAVVEYNEGIFNADVKTLEGEIALAESDLAKAKERLEWAKRMFDKGFVAKEQVVSEELSLQKSKFAREQAQTKKTVLVRYTKDKTTKELTSEVEKVRADELAKRATWESEKAKEEKLREQLEADQAVAPAGRRSGAIQPIEVEALIRDGRVRIRVLPAPADEP